MMPTNAAQATPISTCPARAPPSTSANITGHAVSSAIAKTEAIAILVEKNPNMLAAMFELPAGTEPSIGTRVKMSQTSNVYALVKADGRYYVAAKEIKVTLGGCGG